MFRAQAPLVSALLFTCLPLLSVQPAAAGVARFTPYGPWNGLIHNFTVDPSAPQSLLDITGLHGPYRSDDGGQTWAWSGAGLDLDPQEGIAADPANPGSFYLFTYTEVFHSADHGRSWTRIASGLFPPLSPPREPGPVTLKLLPAGPGAPPTLFVVTFPGLLRSADGGVTWTEVLSSEFLAIDWGLVTDPTDPRRVWVTPPRTSGRQLLTSTDGGQTFTPVQNAPEPLVASLVVPTSPVSLFATGLDGLFKSTDNGATWRKIPQTVIPQAYETATPSIVYATAGAGFFWSSDAGETWTARGAGLPAAGVAGLQTAPGTRTLYGLTDPSTLLRSTDRGRHWSPIAESGAGGGFPTRLRFPPGAPQTVYAVRGGAGYRSANGGATWASFGNLAPSPFRGDAIRDLAIDPTNPELLYVATDRGVFDSTDGGTAWSAASPQVFTTLALAGRRRTLVGAGCGVSRSRDGGRTWSVTLACPTGNPAVSRRIDRLLVDPRNPDVVYAGGVDIASQAGQAGQGLTPRIWKSTDAGAGWQRIVADGEVLALDPSRSGRLYAIRAAGLFRSDDAGRTFRPVSSFAASGSGLQPTALLVDPATPSTLYAATFGQGVWRSIDSGVTWAQINAGVTRYGTLLVLDLVIDPGVPHRLYAILDSGILVNQLTEP